MAKSYDTLQIVIDLGERAFAFNAPIDEFDDGAVRLSPSQAELIISRMAEALRVSALLAVAAKED
jgi:hypothetical protein